jgi:tetratricopeptide (TPR) repeat protein
MAARPGHHSRSGARPAWGEPRPGLASRLLRHGRRLLGMRPSVETSGLPELPLALRRGELASAYLSAEHGGDHARAGAAAARAMEEAIGAESWWPADAWAHRALWHFERADLHLQAARQARRIGDVRTAAGDPASARRYYAEAIDEARDIGAEHEQGLAALGLGRAHLDLGEVTIGRRLASAAVDLLERADAPPAEIQVARQLRGSERAVGERTEEMD